MAPEFISNLLLFLMPTVFTCSQRQHELLPFQRISALHRLRSLNHVGKPDVPLRKAAPGSLPHCFGLRQPL